MRLSAPRSAGIASPAASTARGVVAALPFCYPTGGGARTVVAQTADCGIADIGVIQMRRRAQTRA